MLRKKTVWYTDEMMRKDSRIQELRENGYVDNTDYALW